MEINPRTASALFAAILVELEVFGAPESRPRLPPDTGLGFAQDMHTNLAPRFAAEEAKDPEDRFFGPRKFAELKDMLNGIVDAGMTFYGAELAYQASEAPEDPHRIERNELAPQVRDLDADMFPLLWGKHRKNKPVRVRLEAVRPGQGQRDDSEDVIIMVHIAREHGLDGPLGTPEALADAERKATRLLELQNGAPKPVQHARVLRDRAWARFELRYNTLRRAAIDLTGDEATYPRLSAR